MILYSVALIVAVVFAAYLLLIFPVLSFVHCVRNPQLSTQNKIGWGCLIIFSWTFGACVYGITVSKRPFYKISSVVCGSVMLLALIIRKPLQKYSQQNVSTRQSKKVNLNLSIELKRYEPIFAQYGMTDIFEMYSAGRCEEGKQLFSANSQKYQQDMASRYGKHSAEVLVSMKQVVETGDRLCREIGPKRISVTN